MTNPLIEFHKSEYAAWELNGNAIHDRVSPHFAKCIATFDGEDRHKNAARVFQCVKACDGIKNPAAIKDALECLILSLAHIMRDESEEANAIFRKAMAVLDKLDGGGNGVIA